LPQKRCVLQIQSKYVFFKHEKVKLEKFPIFFYFAYLSIIIFIWKKTLTLALFAIPPHCQTLVGNIPLFAILFAET